jgi:ATP-dependent Clp protease, protease subunit
MKRAPLIQLLHDNKGKSLIKAVANEDLVDVYLKGVISADWGIGAADLRNAFATAAGSPVKLHINSPGGDVFEGREMQAVIAGYAGKVTAVVEGVAASAATIVAMAASQTTMMRGARYMIHNGWTISIGNRHDMQATYNMLASFDAELAKEYAAYTKGDAGQMADWMDAETWFTAEQALEHGFVQSITENSQRSATNMAAADWVLSAYRNAPKDEAPPTQTANEPDHKWLALKDQMQANLRLLDVMP